MPSASAGVRPTGASGRTGTHGARRDRSHAQCSEHGEDPPVVPVRRLVQAAATAEDHSRRRERPRICSALGRRVLARCEPPTLPARWILA